MVHLADRLCGQPVSWGINYLPGWGVQLSAEQVLADMQRAELKATEFQPGLFPTDAAAALRLFDTYALRCVAGWCMCGKPSSACSSSVMSSSKRYCRSRSESVRWAICCRDTAAAFAWCAARCASCSARTCSAIRSASS